MLPHRRHARLALPALALCAAGIVLAPAAQALTFADPAPAAAPHRAPGDVTLTGGDFGTVEVGKSNTVTLTLTNNGTTSVGFDGLPLNLPSGVTRSGGSCDLEVALLAGESCTIELTWTPTAPGPYAGTVSLTVDEDGTVYQVAAQVTGNATLTPTPTSSESSTPAPSESASAGAAPSQGRSEPPQMAHTGSEKTQTGIFLGLGAAVLVGAGLLLTRYSRARRGARP